MQTVRFFRSEVPRAPERGAVLSKTPWKILFRASSTSSHARDAAHHQGTECTCAGPFRCRPQTGNRRRISVQPAYALPRALTRSRARRSYRFVYRRAPTCAVIARNRRGRGRERRTEREREGGRERASIATLFFLFKRAQNFDPQQRLVTNGCTHAFYIFPPRCLVDSTALQWASESCLHLLASSDPFRTLSPSIPPPLPLPLSACLSVSISHSSPPLSHFASWGE